MLIMINYSVIVPANLVSFSFGVYTGWPSPVTTLLSSKLDTPLNNALSQESISWMCSWGYISAIVGTFFWGLLADRFGRKVTGYLTMMPFLVGWVILLTCHSESALMVSRFLGGLGGSGAAINSPMYVGEISDRHTKALLGSMFILMYNLGVLYVYVFGVLFDYTHLNLACLMVSVLFVIVWGCVPETPTCLIRQNKMNEARESLKWFRGKTIDKEVEEEFESLSQRSDQVTVAKASDYLEKGTLRALLIGLVFQAGTQLSGINVILMFTVEIFQKSRSTLMPETCTMVVGVVQVVGSVIASCVVNRAGRKVFLMVTYALTAASLITIGACFYANTLDTAIDTGILPVLSLSLHVLAFSVGVGMVPYIIYTEIFPANVRNVCMSALMFWNNTLGFGVTKAYPFMTRELHDSGCFWLFGAFCLLIVPYTYLFVPETRDKSFDEISGKLLLWFPDRRNKDRDEIADATAAPGVPVSLNVRAISGNKCVAVNAEKDQGCLCAP